jgi:hypothetical protein
MGARASSDAAGRRARGAQAHHLRAALIRERQRRCEQARIVRRALARWPESQALTVIPAAADILADTHRSAA